MNKSKGGILLVVILVVAASSIYAQQGKKTTTKKSGQIQTVPVPPGGELISKAMHDRAREIGNSYWNKRLTKCGTQGAYYMASETTGSFFRDRDGVRSEPGLIIFSEIREPKITLIPEMFVRSRADIMNGLEWRGMVELKGICRTYSQVELAVDRGKWSEYTDASGVLDSIGWKRFQIKNGEVEIDSPVPDFFPVNCEQMAEYTRQNRVLTKPDFRQWLFNEINFEGKCFPSFSNGNWQSPADCSYYRVRK